MREEIRKVTATKRENSFYDVFQKRTYKDEKEYKVIAGISKVSYGKAR